jgi:tRNA pseudouridine38-40 synthase
MRWRIVLEYDGKRFEGWQKQGEKRTIAGAIEAALERIVGPTEIEGSGRTDAGVHALAQVAAFDTEVVRGAREVRDGLNFHLPLDISCVSAELVADDFDPRRWAHQKRYRYSFLDRPSRSPLRDDRAWHLRGKLDVEKMASAAAYLVGRHDFSTFRHTGCGARHPIRQIDAATVARVGEEVHLEVTGNGFLRHMVRIIAGTLADVGLGRRSPESVNDALAARDRARGGPTAPPGGLCLLWVSYYDGPRESAEEDA